MGWKLLQHLSYSPDLAPSNFHLFRPPSKSLREDEDVLQHCVRKFLHIANNAMGSSQLAEQWEHCSELQGKYVRK